MDVLPDDWFEENDGQRLVLNTDKVLEGLKSGWEDIETAPRDGSRILVWATQGLSLDDRPMEHFAAFARFQSGVWVSDPISGIGRGERFGLEAVQWLPNFRTPDKIGNG